MQHLCIPYFKCQQQFEAASLVLVDMHVLNNKTIWPNYHNMLYLPQNNTSFRKIYLPSPVILITTSRDCIIKPPLAMSTFSLYRLFSLGSAESLVSIATGLDCVVETSLDEKNVILGMSIRLLGAFQNHILILPILTGWLNLNTVETVLSDVVAVLFHTK